MLKVKHIFFRIDIPERTVNYFQNKQDLDFIKTLGNSIQKHIFKTFNEPNVKVEFIKY